MISLLLRVFPLAAFACFVAASFPVAAADSAATGTANVIRVREPWQLRKAVADARPGTRIELAGGEYPDSFFFENLHGEAGKPIVITAADVKQPPVFKGGIQLVDPAYVELSDLVIRGAAANAVAIDDGGSYATPAHHVVLHGLRVIDIGPKGNFHAVKLAGVDDFVIRDCEFERWGTGAGIGIDAVGCHRGVIENCLFRHSADPAATGACGVQVKGACREIAIRGNRFENAGDRAINIGGSTGRPYFRPPLEQWPAGEGRYEAREISIERNTFVGSNGVLCFVNVDGAVARFNTIYRPQRWAIRILQETRDPAFVPSRNGVFTDNLVVFDSHSWVEGGCNVGDGTAPKTFHFARNLWYCSDAPAKSQPRLPVAETDGQYGVDPGLTDAAGGDFHVSATSPAAKLGAHAR